MPSKLATALECPLRYLFETEFRSDAVLPSSVAACLGSAIHKVIEAVWSESIESDEVSVRQSVIEEFRAAILQMPVAKAMGDATAQKLGVESLIPQVQFIGRLRVAIRALELFRSGRTGVVPRAPKSVQSSSGAMKPKGQLFSNRLDLAGCADLIERLSEKTIRITEFKTGHAFVGAQIKEGFLLQLVAYGLMVQERTRSDKIVLRIVAADGEYEGELSKDLQEWAGEVLGQLRRVLPKQIALLTNALGRPSHGCSTCRCRPSCSPYLEWASINQTADAVEVPFDVFGIVQTIQQRDAGFLDVRIQQANGIRARIVDVPRLICDAKVGQNVGLYGLLSCETGRGHKFPRNYYVIDFTRKYMSAFSAAGFVYDMEKKT